jgi:hypothetical protein
MNGGESVSWFANSLSAFLLLVKSLLFASFFDSAVVRRRSQKNEACAILKFRSADMLQRLFSPQRVTLTPSGTLLQDSLAGLYQFPSRYGGTAFMTTTIAKEAEHCVCRMEFMKIVTLHGFDLFNFSPVSSKDNFSVN